MADHTLQDLPAEVTKNIGYRFPLSDIIILRKKCRALVNGTWDSFKDLFKDLSVYPHQLVSMNVLQAIADHSVLGTTVCTLRLLVAHFARP
jgi:hypothetical protein